MKINLTEKEKDYLGIEDDRKDFYFKVENAVVDNCEMFETIYEYAVFITLSRYCNCNEISFASCETLAKNSHCSPRKIKDVLKALVEKGLIKKIKRGGNSTDIYKVQTLKKYFSTDKKKEATSLVHGVHHNQSAQDAQLVVHDKSSFGAHGAHNKELLIKNNIKKKNTTTNPKIISNLKKDSSSSIFDFLDLEEFSKINSITKKNIRKNIKELSIDKLREVYKQTESVISKGNGNNFDAILYRGLNGEWNFTTYDKNSSKVLNKNLNENTELEPEKLTWLNHFSGIKADKELFHFIKKSIVNVPLLILNQNRSKLSKMNLFEFRNHVSFLGKQDYSEIS